MHDRRSGGRLATVVAVLLALTVVLAACGDSGGGESGGGKAAGADQAQQAPKGERQTVDASGRSVIRTASLRVEVQNPDDAAEAARKLATDAGGYLAGADASGEGRDRTSTVTIRVPEDRFDATLGQVARLGKVDERSVRSEDVSDRLVDLKGRLENAQTSATRLRELLTQATDIDTIVTLEDRLTKRETDIETLSGQLQALDDQVSLSSIEATFEPMGTDKDPGISHDLPGPLRALRAGAVALINVLLVVLVVVAFALPFALIGLLGFLGYRRWRRRHPRTERASASGSRVWSSPPPPGAWTPSAPPAGAAHPPPPTPGLGSDVGPDDGPAPGGPGAREPEA